MLIGNQTLLRTTNAEKILENLGQIAVARTCFHLQKWRTHVAMGCDVIASDSVTWKNYFLNFADINFVVCFFGALRVKGIL